MLRFASRHSTGPARVATLSARRHAGAAAAVAADAVELIDSHCHLNHRNLRRAYNGTDGAVRRAVSSGVSQLLTISCELDEHAELVAICRRHPGRVFCTTGVHPHCADDARKCGADAHELAEKLLARHASAPDVTVALGECGLDNFKGFSAAEAQEAIFRAHLDAATRSGLPLVVHSRDADDQSMDLLEQYNKVGRGVSGVLHCFNGGEAMARRAVAMGMYVSISGIITFAKGESELKRIVRDAVPEDRLLVETDSPFLAPYPHRGKACEPALVRHTAQVVASVKGWDMATLSRHTVRNTRALFKLPEPPGSAAPAA